MSEEPKNYSFFKLESHNRDLLLLTLSPAAIIFPVPEAHGIIPMYLVIYLYRLYWIFLGVSILALFIANKYSNAYVRNTIFGACLTFIFWFTFFSYEMSFTNSLGIVCLVSASILHYGFIDSLIRAIRYLLNKGN